MKNKLFVLALFISKVLAAQEFDFYMSGFGDDYFIKSLQDSKNNYYLVGNRDLYYPHSSSFITLLNENGKEKKTVFYDTLGKSSFFSDAIWSTDSNIIAVGMTKEDSISNRRPFVMKVDKNLDIIWTKRYNGLRPYSYFFRVRLSNDSSKYYLCGNSNDYDSLIWDGLTAEIDLSGNVIRYVNHDLGNVTSLVWDIISTNDSNYLLVVSNAYIQGIPNLMNGSNKLIKLDSDHYFDTMVDLIGQGVPISNKIHSVNNCQMEWLDTNKLIIQGIVHNNTDSDPTHDHRDLGIVLLDYESLVNDTIIGYGNSGTREQPAYFGMSFKDSSSIFTSVTFDFLQDFKYPQSQKSEFYVVNISGKGRLNWEKLYSNGAHLVCNGILATNDGGALVTGFSYLYGYNQLNERDAYALKIGPNGEAKITPASIDNPIKISDQFLLYPNPSNGQFTIETNNLREGELKIYNSSGMIVYQANLTTQKEQIDLDIPPGIYIVQLITEHGINTNKFIVKY